MTKQAKQNKNEQKSKTKQNKQTFWESTSPKSNNGKIHEFTMVSQPLSPNV